MMLTASRSRASRSFTLSHRKIRRGCQSKLNEALLLLDRRRGSKVEALLREVIRETEGTDQNSNLRARCVLGELLFTHEQDTEARELLRKVAEAQRDEDVLSYEQERARELLGEMSR